MPLSGKAWIYSHKSKEMIYRAAIPTVRRDMRAMMPIRKVPATNGETTMKKFAVVFALFIATGSASAQSLGEALGNYQAQMQNDATDKFCDQLKTFGGLAAQANKKGISRYKFKDTLSQTLAKQGGVTPMQRTVITRVALGMVDDIYIQNITDEGDGVAEGRQYCTQQAQNGM